MKPSTLEQEDWLIFRLSDAMSKKLASNRDRGHWKMAGNYYLHSQATQKLRFLKRAVKSKDKITAQALAADVANYCQMLVDNMAYELPKAMIERMENDGTSIKPGRKKIG